MKNEPRILSEREELILKYFDRYEAYAIKYVDVMKTAMSVLPQMSEEEQDACKVISAHGGMPSFDEWLEQEHRHSVLQWDKFMHDTEGVLPEEFQQRAEAMMRNYEERRDRGEVECLFQEDDPTAMNGYALLPGHRLVVEFPGNECRLFNMAPLLEQPEYAPLKDETVFRDVEMDEECHRLTWCDGAIELLSDVIFDQGERFRWLE